MRINHILSHAAVGGAAAIATYLVLTGQLGIPSSFAQAPATSPGQRSTELFNRVMDDVLHTVSRNASKTGPLKYLVIQVSDTTKPATVPE